MIVKAPITYTSTGRRAATSSVSTKTFHELVTVDIPVIDEEDAQVAVIIEEPGLQFRFYNENYWIPEFVEAWDKENNDYKVPFTAKWERLISDNDRQSPFYIERWKNRKMEPDSVHFSVILESNKDLMLKKLFQRLDNLIIVNGVIHRKCLEPHYTIENVKLKDQEGYTLQGLGSRGYVVAVRYGNEEEYVDIDSGNAYGLITPPPEYLPLFHITEFQKALKQCHERNRTINEENNDLLDRISKGKQAEILRDELYDEISCVEFYIREDIELFLKHMGEKKLSDTEISTETKRLYYDIYDAMKNMRGEQLLVQLEYKCHEMLDSLRFDQENVRHQNFFFALKLALNKLEDRQIALEFPSQGTLKMS